MNKGIVYIIISGLSFMVVNFFVKLLGSSGQQLDWIELQQYPAHELVLARSVISFAISAFIIKRRKIPFFGVNKKWLVIRGTTGMIALTIFFYTLHHLPLAIASTVQYLAPIFTLFFAMWLLGEKILRWQWILILIAFLGVLLISLNNFIIQNDDHVEINLFWLGLGLISAAFSGIAYTAIVKLKPTDQPITIVMYFPMMAIPIMGIWSLYEFVMPKGIEWLFLLIIGVFTQIAQIMLTKALHEGKISVITPFQYLGAVYAVIIGLTIFDERLSWLVYLGILCTVTGVVLNAALKKK